MTRNPLLSPSPNLRTHHPGGVEGFDCQAVVTAVRSVLPPRLQQVALHEPWFDGSEWSYVKECLDIGWVSSGGAFVDRFERTLEEIIGIRRAVAVSSGTAALHICLKLLGITHGDEVLVPTLTFVATANAVTYCGAVPHFVDSEEKTLGMDPRKLAAYLSDIAEVRGGVCVNRLTGARIAAVIPMHVFGHPMDLGALTELCQRFHLPMIEDAAESLGSYYDGRHTGSFGRLAALSFNGNKTITTGGGGAVLTNDDSLGALAKHLSTTARLPHRWSFVHDMVAYNYRLPNLNAALGCAQLEQLPKFLACKRRLSERYRSAFEEMAGVRFFTEPEKCLSNYWLNSLLLDRRYADQRDQLLETACDQGLAMRPVWVLMHKLPIYQTAPRMDDLTVAEDLEKRLVNIPSSAQLGRDVA